MHNNKYYEIKNYYMLILDKLYNWCFIQEHCPNVYVRKICIILRI